MRILLLAVLALAGCKNVAPESEVPAVIINPDDASRAALQQTVNAIFDRDVLLADDALTDTSLLIIERRMPRSIDGSPAAGRTMEMPHQLRLVSDGSNCILVDARDGSRHTLANTSCRPE